MSRSSALAAPFAPPRAAPSTLSAPVVGPDILHPVRQWLRRLLAPAPVSRLGTHAQVVSLAVPPHPLRNTTTPPVIGSMALHARAVHTPRPLRVLRIVDTGRLAIPVTRMRMSGRMSDVCAELDRMVERESAAASAQG